MAEKRPGVMLYFDIEPGLKMLDDPQRGRLLTAIMEYAHFGVVPDFLPATPLRMRAAQLLPFQYRCCS